MKKTYYGSCHCQKIKFEIDADIDSARVCNCSICQKRGALICRVEEDCFRLTSPLDEMSLYEWHTKTAKDYFCSICGILPFRKPRSLTKTEIESGMEPFAGWAVNVRCLENVKLDELTVVTVDGINLD